MHKSNILNQVSVSSTRRRFSCAILFPRKQELIFFAASLMVIFS